MIRYNFIGSKMKISLLKKITLAMLVFIASHTVNAQENSSNDLLLELQHGWAVANYELEGKPKVTAFEALIEKSDANLAQNNNNAEIHVWSGIIKSTLAGAKGGLGALGLVKSARTHHEKAIEIDGSVLSGSAYTSLGVLFYKVPKWPLAFGSKKKAEINLKKALELNPNGIDTNYFYGDFLISKKDYTQAQLFLNKALEASPRPNRPLADSGRRKDIELALDSIKSKL